MNLKNKQMLSIIFSATSVAGTIGTALLVRKAALQEQRLNENGIIPYKSKKDEIMKKLPLYIPSIFLGNATVGSIIGSAVLSARSQATLISMAALANQGLGKYKTKVKDILGFDTHKKVISSIANDDYEKQSIVNFAVQNDGRKLYYEEHLGFFLAHPEKFAYAYSDLNQRLTNPDFGVSWYYALLHDLIRSSEAELLNKEISTDDLNWGWSFEYLMNNYSNSWVHMELNENVTKDGKEFISITWMEEPILDPGNSGEHVLYEKEPEYNTYHPVLADKEKKPKSIKKKGVKKDDE